MDENLVTWDDSYSVGFEHIDNQHKELVKMVNELYTACKMGALKEDIVYLHTVSKALEYARVHFSDEEKYMGIASYPELNEHKKQHEEFVVEIKKSVKLFEIGETAPIELANFLKNWLLNHIAISDKKYAPYLAKLAQITETVK
ncbi:bacteriohemerythrin [Treponema sp. R80B11-R83G3]